MPKVKTHHGGKQSDDIFVKPPQRKIKDKNEGTDNEYHKKTLSDPVSTKNVLECLMKHHKSSVESTKQKSLAIAEKIQKANMAVAERNQENAQLKKRVCEMEQQAEKLKEQNIDLQTDINVLKQQCAALNAKYTTLETGYDEKLANLNAEKSKLKSALLDQNHQKEDLQRQLKREEEQSQQVIAQWESVVREKEDQMVDLQIKLAQLQTQHSQVETAFEQEKLQLEQHFEARLQQKETQLLLLQDEIQQQAAACAQHIEESSRQGEQSQQMIAQLESVVREKEDQMVGLQIKCTQLEEDSSLMNAAFKKEKMQVEQKFKALVELKEKELSQLQSELQQQTVVNSQLNEQNVQREAELQSTLLKLGESETRCVELQKHKNQLSNEALSTAQRFESDLNEKQAKIDELYAYISSFKAGEDHLQSELKALKEANAKLVAERAEQDAYARRELIKLDSQKAELKKQLNEMEQQHLNITNKLSAEKTELAQQFGAFKEDQEKNLAELQDLLRQKEADLIACKKDYADLERLKNSTIAGLKYKMNQIGNVFAQPVGSAAALVNNKDKHQSLTENETVTLSKPTAPVDAPETPGKKAAALESTASSSSQTAEIAAGGVVVSGTIRRRKLLKRPVYQPNNSDFNTDSEDTDRQPEWRPHSSKVTKTKQSSGNIYKLPHDNNALFNKLKRSSLS
ncbi:hypothetical protein ACLKA6_013394 [Drosophila palustris]